MSADAPRFSIVVPTHDRASLVVEAVESALTQTMADREVIVVDDGSTDDTAERLAAFGERIVVLRQERRGPAAAKNRGIAAARGAWVGFLDSDDRWEPTLLETAARAIDACPEAGLVAFRARETDAAGHPTGRVVGKRSPGERYSTASLLGPDAGGCSWFVARRELLEAAGGFDEELRSAEECDLVLRLSFATILIGVEAPLVLRRSHDGNLSRDQELNARSWIRILDALARRRPELLRTHAGAWRRAAAKERLRLGRELLARAGDDPAAVTEARARLAESVRLHPRFARAFLYLAWSWLAPGTFGRWRAIERRRRAERLAPRGRAG